MAMPDGSEVILTGGKSHLVLYHWDEKQLVELYHEKLHNVVELVVWKQWFVAKYKKHNAKLFKMGPENTLGVEGSWPLRMKTFKGQYNTLQLHQFRDNLLLVLDLSHVEEGRALELELFDIEKRESIAQQRYSPPEENELSCLAYSPKFAVLFVIDVHHQGKGYKILQDKEDEKKLVVKFFKKKLISYKDRITCFVNSVGSSHFVAVTDKGNLYISESNNLEFEIKMVGQGHFTDLCLYKEQGNVYGYAPDHESKRYGKISFETRLGNLLMNREFLERKKFEQGGLTRRKAAQADERNVPRGNPGNQGQHEVR